MRYSVSISDKDNQSSHIYDKDVTHANSDNITDCNIKVEAHSHHLLSEDIIRTLKRDIKNLQMMLEQQLGTDDKIHIGQF